jgi:hypothetical protein
MIGYVAAPPGALYWRYSIPKMKGKLMWLLTVGGKSVPGIWYGELGQYLIAWCPLIQRDKELEEKLFGNGQVYE